MHRPHKTFLFLLAVMPHVLTAASSETPPSLRISEGDSHCFASEQIVRTVVLENPSPAAIQAVITWKITAFSASIQEGRTHISVPALTSGTVESRLQMPAVKRAVDLQMTAIATINKGRNIAAQTTVRVYPIPADDPLPWHFIDGKTICLYDPARLATTVIRETLKSTGAKIRVCNSISHEWPEADLLMIAPKAFESEVKWRSFQRQLQENSPDYPVIIFRQNPKIGNTSEPPAQVVLVQSPNKTNALLSDLNIDPRDLTNWHGEDGLGQGSLLMPCYGNFKYLLYPRDRTDAAMAVETFEANGISIIYCQVAVLEKWSEEPACRILLHALMDRAMSNGQKFHYSGVLLCGPPDSTSLGNIAHSIFPQNPEANEQSKDFHFSQELRGKISGFIFVDASSLDDSAEVTHQVLIPLCQYIRNGGSALFYGKSREDLASVKLKLERYFPIDGPSKSKSSEILLQGINPADWDVLTAGKMPLEKLRLGAGKVLLLHADLAKAEPSILRNCLAPLLTKQEVWIGDRPLDHTDGIIRK